MLHLPCVGKLIEAAFVMDACANVRAEDRAALIAAVSSEEPEHPDTLNAAPPCENEKAFGTMGLPPFGRACPQAAFPAQESETRRMRRRRRLRISPPPSVDSV